MALKESDTWPSAPLVFRSALAIQFCWTRRRHGVTIIQLRRSKRSPHWSESARASSTSFIIDTMHARCPSASGNRCSKIFMARRAAMPNPSAKYDVLRIINIWKVSSSFFRAPYCDDQRTHDLSTFTDRASGCSNDAIIFQHRHPSRANRQRDTGNAITKDAALNRAPTRLGK